MQLNFKPIISFLRLPLTVAAAIAIWGSGLPASPGPPQGETVENLVNIRFQNDVRLFAVMAALNAAGFDHETPGSEMSEARQAIRQHLAGLDESLRVRLRLFYEQKLQELQGEQPQAAFTSLSLLLSGPPDFTLEADEATLPADVRVVRGFEELAAEVYQKASLAQLWEAARPRYELELKAYQPIVRDIVRETLDFFRVPARIVLDRQIILTADLLDVKELVNARNLEKLYYIVVGPSDAPENNRRQLEHEYLHFLIDPLIAKHRPLLARHEKLLDLAQRQPRIRSEYQNKFLLVATESLIEGIQLKMHPPDSEAQTRVELAKLYRQGLVFAPFFHRGLESYERSEMVQLPAFLETVFISIDESKIRDDEKFVAAVEEEVRKAEAERLAQRAVEERREQIRVLFDSASQLLQGGDHGGAEAKLREVLQLDPDYANAFFYLAQISLKKQDYEGAFDLYRRTAESDRAPAWVRARSLLSMARILAQKGDYDGARKLFVEVAAMGGDLQGAQAEAEEALSRLPKGS